MTTAQECVARDVTLSSVQLRLLSDSECAGNLSSFEKGVDCDTARDADLRKAVFDAVVLLSEIVSENSLLRLLPFLHCGSWDEVVEERFLGTPRLCGFPTCGETLLVQIKKQRYHIDRQARKIYEHRIESDMYCSQFCMQRSAFVRAQLADEPLWLSGDISKRIRTSYRMEAPLNSKRMFLRNNFIEIVRATDEKISDLRIREVDSSAESEADEEPDDLNVSTYIESVAGLVEEENESDGKIMESRKCFSNATTSCKSPRTETVRKTSIANESAVQGRSKSSCQPQHDTKSVSRPMNPRLPDPQMSLHHSFTTAELEKLSRLRTKYSNRGARKPILIEPSPVIPPKSEKPDGDISAECKSFSETSMEDKVVSQRIVDAVQDLFRGYVTDRTRQLLRSGGLCISSSTSEIMKQFFQPFSAESAVDRNEVLLPNVDNFDVEKKRLHIFLETVKKPLAALQKELSFSFSEFNWLYVIVGTFKLEPDTITNFESSVLKLLCLVLLKLISLLDNVVEDAIFPAQRVSDRFDLCLKNLGVDRSSFDSLIADILRVDEEY